jgi:hypothetical protein
MTVNWDDDFDNDFDEIRQLAMRIWIMAGNEGSYGGQGQIEDRDRCFDLVERDYERLIEITKQLESAWAQHER